MGTDATGGLRFQASDVGWSFMRRKADPLSDPAPLIRRVYAYVAYRIGDGPEAEDVSSEVFERALRYRWSYNPDKASPITWLMAIARRVLADRGGGDQTLVAGDAIDWPIRATWRVRACRGSTSGPRSLNCRRETGSCSGSVTGSSDCRPDR